MESNEAGVRVGIGYAGRAEEGGPDLKERERPGDVQYEYGRHQVTTRLLRQCVTSTISVTGGFAYGNSRFLRLASLVETRVVHDWAASCRPCACAIASGQRRERMGFAAQETMNK
jgi:hypothetical protein